MKALFTVWTISLLSLSATACGGADTVTGSASRASSTASATSTSSAPAAKDSEDKDDDAGSNDDAAIVDYGHAANTADKPAITEVIRRYYAAAAAHDGAKACSILVPRVAEAVPEDYGQAPAPPTLRGKTCAVVMSKLFKQRHRELAAKRATLEVMQARVDAGKALAILHFAATREPQKIPLRREDRTWKILELLDSKMP